MQKAIFSIIAAFVAASPGIAQEKNASPNSTILSPVAREPRSEGTVSTVAQTNSMQVLNDKSKLGNGDRVSYRIVEERKEPILLTVSDSGEMEVPFIGRVNAAGKTCKQLAYELKPLLEKEYFYQATVIVGLETLSTRP